MPRGTARPTSARHLSPRPRRRLAAAVAVPLASAALALPATAADPGEASDDVGTYVAAARDRIDVPHVTVAVSGPGGSRQWAVGDAPRIEPDDQVVVGSVAKSMTAALVAQQVRAGRLGLRDDAGAILDDPDLRGVRVEQLLTHTAGFTALDGLQVSERGASGPGALGEAAADVRATGRAGAYAYSSASYLVLGAVVEEVTGRRFADVLRTDLLEPLGMHDTTALADEADLVPRHRWVLGHAVPSVLAFDESGASYGYVASTVQDLQRWADAQAGGRPDVLDAGMLATLHEPRVDAGADSYAYGWRVDGRGDERLVQHTGAVPGHFAHVLVRPADGSTVVVAADAYGEAEAPVLAAVAPDVLAVLDGEGRVPASADPVLRAAPWALVVLAGAGLVSLLLARRLPRSRPARLTVAVAALGPASVVWWAPGLVGSDLGVLRTWTPDVAWALVAASGAWVAVVLVLVVRRGRPSRRTDCDLEDSSSTQQLRRR